VPPNPFTQGHTAASPEGVSAHGEILERLMQDERNSVVFYGYLAGKAPREDIRDELKNIAEGCGTRLKTYGDICTRLTGKSFTPKENKINTSMTFQSGIALAVTEENKTIRALTDWLDSIPDSSTASAVQNIINKKMANLFYLSNVI
jgi:rubrerythrin